MRYRYAVTILLVFASILYGGYAWPEETLEWKKCVEEAKAAHPDLASARDKVKEDIASKEITRSGAMPQITTNASETTANNRSSTGGSGSSGQSGGSSKSYTTTYSYGLSGQQLLFDGFKTSYDLSAAERTIIASRYNYDVTSSNIRLRLRTAFINLLTAQELLKVAEGIAARRKQNLDLVRLRYEGGREHRGSLLTSEADHAEALYEIEQARRSIYSAQRQLVKELGRGTGDAPLVADGSFDIRETDRARPDFETIARTNPLLNELIAQKEAAKYGIRSASAQFFPQVYLTGSSSRSDTQWLPGKPSWSIGTAVTFPLFEGGSRIATLNKAEATFARSEADERSGRDGVIFTLVDTWTKLQDAIDRVGVQEKFLEASRERAKIAEAEYSIGLLSFDNWIIIEDNLVSDKKNYIAAEQDLLIAEAGWVQAKGGTLEYDEK